VIVICSNKESSPVSYQIIREKCARFQVTTIFTRSGSLTTRPVIAEVFSYGHDSASLKLATDPSASIDAPIAFYTITATKLDTSTSTTVETQRIYYWKDLNLAISSLQASTRYTFTVSATTADGTSQLSLASLPVTTPAYEPPPPPPPTPTPTPTPTLATPAFTLTASSELRTVNTAATGFTITSTGGAIDSFTISPDAPAGMSFSASTGAFTGIPTAVAAATTYTITGTNMSGSTSAGFALHVVDYRTYSLGETGPGGGKIFYIGFDGFSCGPSFSATGSPSGGLCHYLEVASITGNYAWTDIGQTWALNNSTLVSTGFEIGRGYTNSLAIVELGTNSSAGRARGHRTIISGVTYSDWYLPSQNELLKLYENTAARADMKPGQYWSSTGRGNTQAYWVNMEAGGNSFKLKTFVTWVRPIRSF
jgi:hypothetical protein